MSIAGYARIVAGIADAAINNRALFGALKRNPFVTGEKLKRKKTNYTQPNVVSGDESANYGNNPDSLIRLSEMARTGEVLVFDSGYPSAGVAATLDELSLMQS